ncbi:stage 0 sporulation family protein [Deferribacter autotrophicus]|uniref:Stage 0 sporulation family protein n=1 Tax=Deferribacter autotrophicus TaxID=500465 RepID=A0A5A8F2G4_9BACT|nr:stage 0 sporulation family protein [Deferribacter autotrophicus]KAA0257679.1 stage 0 sporulation family protein [Deferribacter autotrophicus]
MIEINAIGVAFKRAGKIYDFLTNNVEAKRGDFVVVESEKGEDIATVVIPDRKIQIEDLSVMKKVLRAATSKDLEQLAQNRKDEIKALAICKQFVKKHKHEMKLLKAEYTLDRKKLTFYFTADGRIDFRELVKDLARVFRTRIEMRQVGVRDATKILGGIGVCGRELCCASFLRTFQNISIKMAKDQNLILNPSKISGVCGRLMCCLMYETYEDDLEEGEFIEFRDILDEQSGGEI